MVPGTRRRFAVMFTDIVGFTSMMEKSEEDALRALERQRSILSSVITKNSGILIKEIGDGTLSVFESPISAVRSARNIQSSLRNAALRVRIGIHWGEVLVGDGDILGDTVNVASRLEALPSRRDMRLRRAHGVLFREETCCGTSASSSAAPDRSTKPSR